MNDTTIQTVNPSVTIPLRPIGQVALALALAIPTLLLGHLVAFGLAHLGESFGPYPTSNFFYAAGEGLMASVCFAIFLLRVAASVPARLWCWVAAFILWTGAMPAWGILHGEETMHFALIIILGVTSFLAWLVLLPWWRPKWMTRDAG